ncbi:histidinol-phosphate aminotransferase [Ferroglobus placidus DSM 10642]|uniref:Histidinol-phosphate aminotransferase n=1 Tax=Ferroglobus placidus (strain DSM 10642 / AEDII12DO) TaxID=589924 RepID=D3RZ63_FERPA|nr:histidinol-phosphate transaminase [Ferroglobus placidus]ADC65776.1 histidinol-phosphate aminotransferase [Ferroglobus placidus DSM 10642]
MIRKELSEVPEYVPGKSVEEIKRTYGLEKVVKLASNENPYGASPKVFEALKNFRDFHVYPPKDPIELRERIAEYVGFPEKMIVVGAGLDGVLENVFKMFVNKGDVVAIPIPTFPYYEILAKIYGAKIKFLRRKENFETAEFDERAKLTIICSPNNPTGNVENFEFVREVVESVKGIVFIDEAYAEFTEKRLTKLAEYENVIVGRTFSKAFGLANLRIGYAIMNENFAREYMKVCPPFSISTIAILAAIAALDDIEYMNKAVKKIVAERSRLEKALGKYFRVYPSEANFLYVEAENSDEVCYELERRGVIVRNLKNFRGVKNGIRITVGKPEENNFLLKALEEIF